MNGRTFLLLAALLFSQSLIAQTRPSPEAVLRTYFGPGAEIRRERVFLDAGQKAQVERLARSPLPSSIVTLFRVSEQGRVAGYGILETAVVRTMPATYLVVVQPDTTVRAIELVAFAEPDDYLPPDRWLAQFEGRALTDDLWMKRGIRNITGATLSAHVLTAGARRALALVATLEHRVRQ